jgi:uncharacterized membrane protein YphA (DoxX/SURF4 family)
MALNCSRTSLAWPAVIAVVALRFVVGAHFFHEGFTKWRDPKPFSAPVFGAAKGPFAGFFRSLVWDPDAEARLNEDETFQLWGVDFPNKKDEPQFTGGGYLGQATRHFGFDDAQASKAGELVLARVNQYRAALDAWEPEIREYRYGLDRRRSNQEDPSRGLASFKKHDTRIASELMSKLAPWRSEIDSIWNGLEKDINNLADEEGLAGRGWLSIQKPGRRWLDSITFDHYVPYFDMAVGVLLVMGLFTRVTASLGAAFLATIIASQWPFSSDSMATGYQQVEMCAMLVLATIGAGKYAGFDALLSCCCGWGRKEPTTVPLKTPTPAATVRR